MFGTAGLPHVIVRFFTVPKVSDARKSAGYALVFIALLYTTAPAVATFAKINFINSVQEVEYKQAPNWFKNWEDIGLIAWKDKNNDGIINYSKGNALEGVKPKYLDDKEGDYGERITTNSPDFSNSNEIYIDNDIMVLANPEIAQLPNWVIALVAAGALAAALSTAAGLLLVISASISHDLMKKILMPKITEKQELFFARCAAAAAIIIAGLFGIYPPGFVAQVVAFAFGLAASTIFPALFLGIFYKRLNKEGAIAGMISGLIATSSYITYFKFINPQLNVAENWLFGISPEGIGFLGMIMNFVIALIVSNFYSKPPKEIYQMIDEIRKP
jgi:cation/acetate symporter